MTGSQGLIVAENTMGQDAGGTLTRIDGATGRSAPLRIQDHGMSPFLAQVLRFGEALRSGRSSEFSGERDLHTMRLVAQAYRGETQA